MNYTTGTLDRLHAEVKGTRWLWWFTWFTRVLLAIGFIPPGLIKAFALPFTNVDPSAPVGYFFDALYRTGFFYRFIGMCQVVAAAFLLIPQTATLGALMYFPLICGILAINVSLDFGTTIVITTLMVLGNIYLLCWDYDRLKHVLWHTTR
jgi:hypothetical protein